MAQIRYLGHPVIHVLTTRVEGCRSIAVGEVVEVADEAVPGLLEKYPGLLEVVSSAAAGPAVDRAIKAPAKKKAAAKAKPKAKAQAAKKTTRKRTTNKDKA